MNDIKVIPNLPRCCKGHVSTELVVQFLKIFDNRFVVSTSPTSYELRTDEFTWCRLSILMGSSSLTTITIDDINYFWLQYLKTKPQHVIFTI